MIVLRATDRAATRWKNGLGVTREVYAHPLGAGLDDFDWRVSMASVDAGGPFSAFPGIDRRLAVLQGTLALRIAGRAPVELDADSPPVQFAGDIAVESELLAGPVLDLNVMTRRGRFSSQLDSLTIKEPTTIAAFGTTIVLTRTDGVVLSLQHRSVELGCDDAVLVDEAAELRLEPSQPTRLFAISLAAE